MSIQLKPINEQVVVITGASSGIGLAAAYSFAKKGATVVLAARSEDVLRRVTQELVGMGRNATFVVADVSSAEDVKRIAREAIDLYGRIDTWVNDAGVSIYGRLDQVEEADSRTLFDINFWGVVNGSLIALRNMRGLGGAIINVGSEVSEAVVPLQGMYSASKHAVKGFTDALRIEVEEIDKAPIAITLIQPTAVNTPYPQHAANYMEKEPKLPTPQIDPQQDRRSHPRQTWAAVVAASAAKARRCIHVVELMGPAASKGSAGGRDDAASTAARDAPIG